MTKPLLFFETVVIPNIHAVEAAPDDMRLVVNAILTLDALVGILLEHLRAAGHPEVADLKGDEGFRDRLAGRCPGYAAIRDASAALKHGALTYGKKARVIRMPDQIQSTENVLGLFANDDENGGAHRRLMPGGRR
ncbi:hypothetical protein [Methylobacterium sp. WL6]|uniref:hypothetical protein n=1 Tax=Methylobacterium sp. WL6 TaxID=2603901 RepID=UPI0011CC5ECD|nr:hypothetical protein [Methylobacterium sp. WL6]TXN72827.1 hypothetical protein FV230_03355 [Methylobacterium sp. WL6]